MQSKPFARIEFGDVFKDHYSAWIDKTLLWTSPDKETMTLHVGNINAAHNARVKAALCERMADKLAVILPMAKGYAAEHPVGSNQKYVESAEEAKDEYDKEARG